MIIYFVLIGNVFSFPSYTIVNVSDVTEIHNTIGLSIAKHEQESSVYVFANALE